MEHASFMDPSSVCNTPSHSGNSVCHIQRLLVTLGEIIMFKPYFLGLELKVATNPICLFSFKL